MFVNAFVQMSIYNAGQPYVSNEGNLHCTPLKPPFVHAQLEIFVAHCSSHKVGCFTGRNRKDFGRENATSHCTVNAYVLKL